MQPLSKRRSRSKRFRPFIRKKVVSIMVTMTCKIIFAFRRFLVPPQSRFAEAGNLQILNDPLVCIIRDTFRFVSHVDQDY